MEEGERGTGGRSGEWGQGGGEGRGGTWSYRLKQFLMISFNEEMALRLME
jgi:hypothetical protein